MKEERQMTFERLGLAAVLADELGETGIAAPTSVQAGAIPALLAGRDGVIVSPTGTGKTLAYLLPILQRLNGALRETQALVLAPTQELAMQIVREAQRYGEPLGIKTAALIGGAALSRQLERMKAKPALVVGTPGRVREVVSLRKLSLPGVRHFVVDETDRVFSLGGRADVEKLLRQCAKERQTVFVSATRTDAMREAEQSWLSDPWVASDETQAASGMGADEGERGGLPGTIRHWYFVEDRRSKVDLVRRLLRHTKMKPALMFVNDTEKIGELSAKLKYEGVSVDTLYGDTAGRERGEALRRFRAGKTALLIATDLAARGLDVPGLPLVIQFEPALDADHYVHRAGRTGRMGKEGVSVTIVAPQELFIAEKLAKQLGIRMERKALYEGRVVAAEEAGSGQRGAKSEREGAGRRTVSSEPAAADKRGKDGEGSRADGGGAGQRGREGREGDASGSGTGPKRAGALGRSADSKRTGALQRTGAPKQNAARGRGLAGPASGAGPRASSQPAAPAKKRAGREKQERERDRKNKGAPRWLKQKREAGSDPGKER